jgi:hypothetical protein
MDDSDKKKKAIADRKRFESIKKIAIRPLITTPPKAIAGPDLRSPEERQTIWVEDPEEARAETRKRRLLKKRNNKDG